MIAESAIRLAWAATAVTDETVRLRIDGLEKRDLEMLLGADKAIRKVADGMVVNPEVLHCSVREPRGESGAEEPRRPS